MSVSAIRWVFIGMSISEKTAYQPMLSGAEILSEPLTIAVGESHHGGDLMLAPKQLLSPIRLVRKSGENNDTQRQPYICDGGRIGLCALRCDYSFALRVRQQRAKGR